MCQSNEKPIIALAEASREIRLRIMSGRLRFDLRTNRVCSSFVDAEDELLTSLATHGPVAAAVNAISWQNYLGGVIQYHCDGSYNSLNHAVQIVGYDLSAGIPHYIVRNSWGPTFGDKGYIYIAIGGNLCGKITRESRDVRGNSID